MTELSNTTAVPPRSIRPPRSRYEHKQKQQHNKVKVLHRCDEIGTTTVLTFDALRVQVQLYDAPRAVDTHAKPGVHGIHAHLPPLRY